MHKILACCLVLALTPSDLWADAHEEPIPDFEENGGEDPFASETESETEIDTEDVLEHDPSAGVQPSDVMMVLPEKQVYLQLFVPINLSTDAAFKPVSLAPDLWVGVKPKLTIGLTHSRHATDGFFGGPAAGICFVGEDNGCPEVLQNTGVQVRYALPVHELPLAAEGGLVFRAYDPFAVALKLGVVGRWQRKALSVLFGLNFFAGLSERDAGNKEIVNLPITAMYSLTAEASVGVQTGVGIPFENTSDLYFVPLAAGGRYMVTPKINVDLIFSLPFLISGVNGINGFDSRVLTLAGGYAF